MRKLNVLFLCTGNSCRSQMAEGWARALRSDSLSPYSAGTEARGLDPRAVAVMAEAGVDISNQRSKRVDALEMVRFDCVITVCDDAEARCPAFAAGVGRLHRGFEDPPKLAEAAASEEQALEHYRRVRDQIRRFVESLPGTLPPS